jgi:hypothetical protein
MSKHKKKKQSQHSRQKVISAHHRNEFFYKLRYLCNLVTGDPSVYRLIPEKEYDYIYLRRFHSFRTIAAPGYEVPDEVLLDAREFNEALLCEITTNYPINGPKITLGLFFTVGLTLATYVDRLKPDAYPTAKLLREKLAMLTQDNCVDEQSVFALLLKNSAEFAWSIAFNYSNYQDKIYWADVGPELDDKGGSACIYYGVKIKNYRPALKPMMIDGIFRTVHEICWASSGQGVIHCTIGQDRLGIRERKLNKELAVFIQAHALHRLEERLDCLPRHFLHFCIYLSVSAGSIIKGSDHTFLIEYKLLYKKAGYLLAGLHDGVLVIHTFLFLTNNGTPEGKKLHEITGLGKLDKEYLLIDKLSTFYASDISGNEEVKQLFISAGCQSLFEIDQVFLEKERLGAPRSLADRIKDYLKVTDTGEDQGTYEKEQMPVTG